MSKPETVTTEFRCNVDMSGIERRIATLAALQPGWYGDGIENSQPISQAALTTARAIACVMIALGQSPTLFPRTCGGVTVECIATDVYIEADGHVSSVVT